jgi:hypothetical protein
MAVATFSFVRLGRNERDGRYRLALLFGTLVSFAFFKLWAIGTERVGELILSCVFDAGVWVGAWLLGELVAAGRRRYSEIAAGVVFYPVLYLTGALVFAHTYFYDAAIERRLTALDVTASGVVAFFREALPVRGYVALALVLIFMHLLALIASVLVYRPTLLQALFSGLPLLLCAGLAARLAPRTPSVLFDTGKELAELILLPRLAPEPCADSARLVSGLDKSQPWLEPPVPRFKKVIVLVMETMTSERLARESDALDKTSFFKAESAHLHRYVRYFPNNQDSRTGMLNMLSARMIPYEAYSDVGVAGYEKLTTQLSLPDRFRALGYRSAFAVSQEQLEEVVRDLPWDERLNLTQADIDRARSKLLCFEPDEWENGCEDLALLPKLVDFVASHEQAFVYQEFIWGHAYEYNAASGRTNAHYYSAYVDALLEQLRARGLLEQSLIVVTSDHGFRDKSKQAELASLQIPLVFYASRFAAEDDGRLLSHVDFKDLLFAELSEQPELVSPSEWLMIVGPTGSHMFSGLSTFGDFALLRERNGVTQLLDQRSASPHAPTPNQLLYVFERYRAAFDRALAHPAR